MGFLGALTSNLNRIWVSTSPEVGTRLLSRLTKGRRKRLVAITRAADNTLGHQKPAPAKVPTIAEHQSVAAVLIPCTLIPSRRITPAPRKPMPEITCAAILVGSPCPISVEKTTNPQEPRATRALVLSPAIFWFHCRSNPIAGPSARARPSLKIVSSDSGDVIIGCGHSSTSCGI